MEYPMNWGQTILHLQAVSCKILHLHGDLELLPLARDIPSLRIELYAREKVLAAQENYYDHHAKPLNVYS